VTIIFEHDPSSIHLYYIYVCPNFIFQLIDIRTRLKFYGNWFIYFLVYGLLCLGYLLPNSNVCCVDCLRRALTIPDCVGENLVLLDCCALCTVGSMMDWSLMRTDFSLLLFFFPATAVIWLERRPPCRLPKYTSTQNGRLCTLLHATSHTHTHTPIVLLGKRTEKNKTGGTVFLLWKWRT
jgi:hypothetical protein